MISLHFNKLQAVSRSFATYVPKNPVVLNSSKPHLLYNYEGYSNEKRTFKYLLCIPPVFGLLWAGEFYLTRRFSNIFLSSFKLSLILSIFPAFALLGNKNRVTEMNLRSDGQHIELSIAGKLKSQAITLPISDCKWEKGEEFFKVTYGKQQYLLDQDGKIHDLELFYAVLRSLSIEPSFITLKNN